MNELVDFGLEQELTKGGIIYRPGTVLRLTRSKAEWLEQNGIGKIKPAQDSTPSKIEPEILLPKRKGWSSKW